MLAYVTMGAMTYHRLGAVVLNVSALALIGVAAPAAPAAAAVDCSTTAPFDPRVGAIQPANGTLSTSFRVTVTDLGSANGTDVAPEAQGSGGAGRPRTI